MWASVRMKLLEAILRCSRDFHGFYLQEHLFLMGKSEEKFPAGSGTQGKGNPSEICPEHSA